MAHRFLAEYPQLKPFMFIYVGYDDTVVAPINGELERLTGVRMINRYSFYNQIDRFYQNTATDEDIVLMDGERQVVDTVEEAQYIQMHVGMTTPDGVPVWIEGELNRQRDKSPFIAKRVIVKRDEPAVSDFAEQSDNAKIESADCQSLRHMYPDLRQLAFIDYNRAKSDLSAAGADVSRVMPQSVLEQICDNYQRITDDEIAFTYCGTACKSWQEADTITLPSGYFSGESSIAMHLVRNYVQDRQPWILARFEAPLPEGAHRFLKNYGKLLGTTPECLVFITADGADALSNQLRTRAIGLPAYANCVDELNQRYYTASDEAFELLDASLSPVDTIAEADKLRFNTGLMDKDGKALHLIFYKNVNAGYQPFSTFSLAKEDEQYPGVSPRETITRWASIDNFPAVVRKLRELAMDETWTFKGGQENAILDNYLRYTFAKAFRKSGGGRNAKIKVNRANNVAVFNTGLVNQSMVEIYMMFKPNEGASGGDAKKWAFWKFATTDDHDRALTNAGFAEGDLPGRPQFWSKTSDLVYPLSSDQTIDVQLPHYNREHVIDRLYRLPSQFIEHCCFRMPAAEKAGIGEIIAHSKTGLSENQLKEMWRPVSDAARANAAFRNALETEIDAAIKSAIRKQMLDYKTVIPYYHPRNDRMDFLLPLDLTGRPEDCVAMVLEKDNIGSTYYGRTILTMDMAYKNSRLICKPEVNWLQLQNISATAEAEEE